MFPLYSLLYTIAFVLMLPLFLLRREKYAAGFAQRLGKYPKFGSDDRPVIWLHAVSVGEANAARPLVKAIRERFPGHRLVISTTTATGQKLAQEIFKGEADAVVYFPFDWKFSVRRALRQYQPAVVLLMETEIWPRFIHEAKLSGAKVAIVNGRLSERSYRRYSFVRGFIERVLRDVDLALMQDETDAGRISALGLGSSKLDVTGNLKFEIGSIAGSETTEYFRWRFDLKGSPLLIVAASTHAPEERLILEALKDVDIEYRLMIVPRHPQRFDAVAKLIGEFGFDPARRSHVESQRDSSAKVILLDSIGELRAVYPLADIVFVGGSLIPHGGQSVLEPAAAGKAIVTGPHTHNFAAVMKEFLRREAAIQIPPQRSDDEYVERLYEAFTDLALDRDLRDRLGRAALEAIDSNRGATERAVNALDRQLITNY
ncbi:MAG: 3-deoxy-D-manno-octulosonic acid transferase [Pyrinomonadaceae bacterium]